MPGVRAIFIAATSANCSDRLRASDSGADIAHVDEARPPFDDDVIRYYGQLSPWRWPTRWSRPKPAADAVEVTYRKEKPNVDLDLDPEKDPSGE